MINETLYANNSTLKHRILALVRDTVCMYYKQNKNIFNIKDRRKEVIKAKHSAIYLASKTVKTGPTELGSFFKCDHSSVAHAIKKIEGYLRYDKILKEEFTEIQKIILSQGVSEVKEKLQTDEKGYFISLDDCISIIPEKGRAIILSGYSETELIRFMDANKLHPPIRSHQNTGLYIYEKK